MANRGTAYRRIISRSLTRVIRCATADAGSSMFSTCRSVAARVSSHAGPSLGGGRGAHLDAVAKKHVDLGRARREHDAGAVKQLDVLVELHQLAIGERAVEERGEGQGRAKAAQNPSRPSAFPPACVLFHAPERSW